MTYRVLDVSEWAALEPEFSGRGVTLPSPDRSFIVGAFKESGELAGFMVCQQQIHAEPLVLYDPRAFRGLLRAVERQLRGLFPAGISYFVTTPRGRTSDMAEAMGIKKTDLELRIKTLEPLVLHDARAFREMLPKREVA